MQACATCGAPLPTGARFCPSCGAAASPPSRVEERKLATVLFADLVGSTAFASDRDPERVRAVLDRFYTAMSREIEIRGGTVEKFAGDAVMAVFGAPAALEDHAERALHAALAMQRRHAELFPDLGLRIGVNTGEVVSGAVLEMSGYVTGDAVNVGARLEQAAASGEILVGERTIAAAAGAFEFGSRRVVEAKGKPEGVPGYPVLRALTLTRPRGVGGLQRAFVGRERELELLSTTYRRAVELGEPHLVTIFGEPGIGKTRLVRELWELLAGEEPAPLRRTGRCLPYGDGITYWPLGDLLREHYGIAEDDSAAEIARRLPGRDILGLALGLPPAQELHPLDVREQLHAAAADFFRELVAERPLAVLLEDVHWAEGDLLDLLERILSEVHGSLVLLATARPELLDKRPTWSGGRRNATSIWLEPLRADSTSAMLAGLLAVELPAEIRELVVERAGGNPFFVEELVGSLIDARVLQKKERGWTVDELPEGFTIPDTVHAVVAARIDRLPPTERAALQAASVVGRTFWPSAVRHLLGGEEPDFGLLEERDLIRLASLSSASGEREYAMKHALTRDVAYAGIAKARRARLHASLADWLAEGNAPADELAPLLAYHYAEAVRPEDADLAWGEGGNELGRLRKSAVRWVRRAGVLARSRHEMDEAVELFERAIGLADDAEDEAELWFELGLTKALVYDGDGFWTAMRRGLELGALDREAEAEAYAQLAFQTAIRSGMWLNRPDLAELPLWIDRALELTEPRSRTRAEALLAQAYATRATEDDAAAEAEAIAEELGDLVLQSYALGARSGAAFTAGRFHEAVALAGRRLALLDRVDMLDHLCDAYESFVPIMVSVGRFDEARRIADLHAQASARLSPHHRMHSAAIEVEIAENLGRWDGARAMTQRALAAAEANVGTPCIRNARTLIACGLSFAVDGDEARAAELFERAQRFQGEGWSANIDALWLRLALVRDDRQEAERLVEARFDRDFVFGPSHWATLLDALAVLRRADRLEQLAPRGLQPSTYLEPFALRALGVVRCDDDLLARADECFATLGLEWHRAQTERLLAGF